MFFHLSIFSKKSIFCKKRGFEFPLLILIHDLSSAPSFQNKSETRTAVWDEFHLKGISSLISVIHMAIRMWLKFQLASPYCDEHVTLVAGSFTHDRAVQRSQKIKKSFEHKQRCSKRTQFAQISNATWNPEPQSNRGWWHHDHEPLSNRVRTAVCMKL